MSGLPAACVSFTAALAQNIVHYCQDPSLQAQYSINLTVMRLSRYPSSLPSFSHQFFACSQLWYEERVMLSRDYIAC